MHFIKNKTKKIVSICIFLVLASLVTFDRYNQKSSLEKYPSLKIDKEIKQADILWTYNLTGSAGIYIDDSNPSYDWATNAANWDWITGAGTQGNPYEIKNVLFDGEKRQNLNLITIENSVAYFNIEHCILYNTYGNYWNEDQGNAIILENVENGEIFNVNTSDCTNGIRLINSVDNGMLRIFARDNIRSGITISGGSNNEIKNSTFSSVNRDVGSAEIRLLDGTFNNDVLENIIMAGDNGEGGIYLTNSHYNNVTFNVISDRQGSSGIVLGSSDFNNISENTVRNSGVGLSIYSSENNIVSANSFINNSHYSYDQEDLDLFDPDTQYGFGLLIVSSSWNTISKNIISESEFYGIYVKDSANESIWENTVMNNGFDDIHLFNTLSIDLALNEMYGSGLYFDIPYSGLADINIETSNLVHGKPIYFYVNQSGLGPVDFINAGQIFLFDCNDIAISGSEFDGVTAGITLRRCINSTISSNEASNNSRWAFSLFSCDYNRILNNDVIRSSITLENSNHTKLIGNTASYSTKNGISIENCYNNYLSGNTATYNHEIGIRLYRTYHSLIHDNIANYNDECGISLIGMNWDWVWNGTEWIYASFYLLNNTLTSNMANDNGVIGIKIMYVEDITIVANIAKKNEEGISLSWFESGIITENEVTSNEHGLTVKNGLGAYVNNNTATSNGKYLGQSSYRRGEGILISSCQQVEVNDNEANGNSQGLELLDCYNCEVENNHLSENGKVESFFLFPTNSRGDAGILLTGSFYINVTANILDENGIGVSGGGNNRLFLNQITDFGFLIEDSVGNIISGNLITGALIAIELDTSSFNNITFNIIVAQQCFRERGNCTANVFEDNDCTEVLPEFYLREIISLVGLASVLGLNIPLFLKKRKARK